jgi:hypothetical protein
MMMRSRISQILRIKVSREHIDYSAAYSLGVDNNPVAVAKSALAVVNQGKVDLSERPSKTQTPKTIREPSKAVKRDEEKAAPPRSLDTSSKLSACKLPIKEYAAPSRHLIDNQTKIKPLAKDFSSKSAVKSFQIAEVSASSPTELSQVRSKESILISLVSLPDPRLLACRCRQLAPLPSP